MNELIFNSAKDYLEYDFDDSYCFYHEELKEHGENSLRDPALVDYEGKYKKIITDLFKIYEALILIPEEETLLGLIGKSRFLIKRSPIEL